MAIFFSALPPREVKPSSASMFFQALEVLDSSKHFLTLSLCFQMTSVLTPKCTQQFGLNYLGTIFHTSARLKEPGGSVSDADASWLPSSLRDADIQKNRYGNEAMISNNIKHMT